MVMVQNFELKVNVVELEVLETLKERLTFPPILALQQQRQLYASDTDTCHCKVRCVLLWKQPSRKDVSHRLLQQTPISTGGEMVHH